MTRKYYYSLYLEEKYKQAEHDAKNPNLFITYLNQSFSVLIIQGSERLLLICQLSLNTDDFSERISYYQDNDMRKKEGTKLKNVIYVLWLELILFFLFLFSCLYVLE